MPKIDASIAIAYDAAIFIGKFIAGKDLSNLSYGYKSKNSTIIPKNNKEDIRQVYLTFPQNAASTSFFILTLRKPTRRSWFVDQVMLIDHDKGYLQIDYQKGIFPNQLSLEREARVLTSLTNQSLYELLPKQAIIAKLKISWPQKNCYPSTITATTAWPRTTTEFKFGQIEEFPFFEIL